jgi:hypothetical protein
MPVYFSLKEHLTQSKAALGSGVREPQGWAVSDEGRWDAVAANGAPFGYTRVGSGGAALNFAFSGTALAVDTTCPAEAGCDGLMKVYIEGREPVTLTANSGIQWVAQGLTAGEREVTVEVLEGRAGVAALTVRRELPRALLWLALGLIGAAALYLVVTRLIRFGRARRTPTYAPEPRFPEPDEPPVYPRRKLWRGVKE